VPRQSNAPSVPKPVPKWIATVPGQTFRVEVEAHTKGEARARLKEGLKLELLPLGTLIERQEPQS
jgi:hypothetical protein